MLYDSELFNNQPLATTLLEAFQSWPFSLSNLARVYVEQPESNRNIRAINNSSAPGKRKKKNCDCRCYAFCRRRTHGHNVLMCRRHAAQSSTKNANLSLARSPTSSGWFNAHRICCYVASLCRI